MESGSIDEKQQELTLVGHAMFRSFRNLWMLEEMGIPYRNVAAKPQSKDAKSANPFGKVPALVDGDFAMFESAAINTYLGDRQRQEGPLAQAMVPAPGTQTRGRYEMLVSCMQTEMDAQCLWIHRKHEAMGKVFGDIPEAVAHARSHFGNVLRVLLGELVKSGGCYLLGEQFSAADILLVHCLDWAGSIGWLEDAKITAEERSSMESYLKLCRSRPAYGRTAAMRASKL